MSEAARRQALVWCAFAALAVLLLSMGLPGMQLAPGLPFPGADTRGQPLPDAGPAAPAPVTSLTWLEGLLSLAFFAVLAYIALHLALRMHIFSLRHVLAVGLGLLLLVVLLALIHPGETGYTPAAPETVATAAVTHYAVTPLGSPTPFLLWLVSGVLLILVLALALWLLRRALRQRTAPDPLAQQAEAALQALRSGGDLKEVILRCYQQMQQTLQEQQGIERHPYLTAHEFETLLHGRGIPPQPLERLTHLFEFVRYSPHPPGPQDEQDALESLAAVAEYCRLHPVEKRDKDAQDE
jgi:hypothetical protein